MLHGVEADLKPLLGDAVLMLMLILGNFNSVASLQSAGHAGVDKIRFLTHVQEVLLRVYTCFLSPCGFKFLANGSA